MIDYGVFLDFLYRRVHLEIDGRDSLDPEFWDCFERNLDIIVSDFDRDVLSCKSCDSMTVSQMDDFLLEQKKSGVDELLAYRRLMDVLRSGEDSKENSLTSDNKCDNI